MARINDGGGAPGVRRWIRSVSSWLPPILNLLIVVGIGVYASLRTQVLKQAFPFACLEEDVPCWQMSWEAAIFYGVVIGVLLPIVYLQMKSQAQQQAETERLLIETRALVDTAPPKRILTYVRGKYLWARTTCNRLTEQGEVEDQDVAYAIRVVLRAMLDVAHYWDNHTDEGSRYHYRGTIMLVDPADAYAAPEQRLLLQTHLRFADRNAIAAESGWRHFDLYLRTEQVFSASNHVDPQMPDASSKLLILGAHAPSEQRAEPVGMVIGAPFSLFYGYAQYIPDTSRIAMRLQQDPYFKKWSSEVEEFYSADHNARSILSIPLSIDGEVHHSWTAQNCPYLAVVNIFRDGVDMLGGKRQSGEQFSDLMTPFCDMLQQLIGAYLSAVERNNL